MDSFALIAIFLYLSCSSEVRRKYIPVKCRNFNLCYYWYI